MPIRDTDVVFDTDSMAPANTGLIPRDYQSFPVGYYQQGYQFGMRAVKDIELIPFEEWPERIRQKDADKSWLSDIWDALNIDALDQDGQGYCWSYSTTGAVMSLRARMGLPTVRLSGHALACIIKNYRDEGGWGALSLDAAMNGLTKNGRTYKGIPSVLSWKEQSMSPSNDTAACWENAALHAPTEGFVDVEARVYDRELSAHQIGSLLLSDIPVISDYNWWGHSVQLQRIADQAPAKSPRDPSRYATGCRNSWGNKWGIRGFGLLVGSKAWPNGAVAPRACVVSQR